MSSTAQQDEGVGQSLSELAYKALCEEYGQGQDRRQVGYFRSQSLKKLIGVLDGPEQIQELRARRRVDHTTRDVFGGEEFLDWLDATETTNEDWTINYDRSIHPPFDWEYLKDRLAENPDVFDMPVSHVVIKLDDEGLREHWIRFMRTALDKHPDIHGEELPTAWVKPPFFAVMSSVPPEETYIRDSIEDYHRDDPWYFQPPSEGDGRRGLGWRPRALDLDAIWSQRGFIDKHDVVATRKIRGQETITRDPEATATTEALTPRKLEDELVNADDEEQPYVTGINAPVFISKWSGAFDEGTERKAYRWDEHGEWVLSGGGDRDGQ
jgi:hypothetical protein